MSLRRLSRNAFAAMAQVVVSAAVLFVFYRFLIRQLGPEEIGVWSLVVASTAVARLGEFGLGGGVTRFVAGDLGAGDGERAPGTIGMCVVAIGAIVGVGCLALQPMLHAGLGQMIADARLLEAARGLLPWTLAALWFGSVSQVFLSALDGCQRSELKATIIVAAAIGQLGAAYMIVPTQGLKGLGPVQLVQAGLTTVFAIGFLVATLRYPIGTWFAWDRARFVEVVRYGGGVQLGALGQLLFEPTVKAMLSVFGGLGLTGYYEMANRAVTQFRAIIVAAYQMLVPYLSHRAGNRELDPTQIAGVYSMAQTLLFMLAIPYFAFLAAMLPLILTLWLGRFDANFVRIGLLCVAGWALNTLNTPAYMFYLAIGRLRWTIWTQIMIGILNVTLAGTGGWLFGGFGVVVGAMIALAIGSMVVTLAFHTEFDVSWREFVPPASAPLVAMSIIGATVLIAVQLHAGVPMHPSAEIVVAFAALALGSAVLVWRHPAIVEITRRLRAALITR